MIVYFSILSATVMVFTKGNTPEVKERHNPKAKHIPPPTLHDFKELLWQGCLYVDKSLLIETFLNVSEKGPIVINQPISWGKSLNLDMLRRFFELEVNEEGVELPSDRKINKKLFAGGEVSFGNEKKVLPKLNIMKHADLVEKYLGKFPVIFFSLKNIFHVDFNKMKSRLANRLTNLYTEKYSYLKKYSSADDNAIADLNKTEVRRYFDGEICADSDLQNALFTLSYLLKRHHQKRVVVLIDDYEEVIQYAIQKYADNETEEVIKYIDTIANLLGAVLKGNPHIERSCLTGTFPFNEFGPSLDNLNHYLIPDNVFSKYYAFTEEEVIKLLVAPSETQLQDIKAWYNGIEFGGHSFYNPASILQYLKNNGKLERYIVQKDRLDFLEGQSINADLYEISLQRFFPNQTTRLFYYTPVHPTCEGVIGKPTSDVMYFWLYGGYLGFEECQQYAGYLYTFIPNYEAMYFYERLQLRWTTRDLGFNKGWQVAPASLLGNYKIKEFETELQKVLSTTDRLNDVNFTTSITDRAYYNGLLLSLACSMPADFLLVAGVENELAGRVDLLFVPSRTSKSKDCIVIHFDVLMTSINETLPEYADLKAKSIELDKYDSKLKPFSYLLHVYKIFIVFRKNELAVGEFKVINYRVNEDVVIDV